MSTGFIALHRKFKDWEWYGDINTKTVFIDLLISATYKHKSYQGIELNPGDVLTSLERISKNTNLTVRNVRTAINHLISTGEVTSRPTSRGRVITIVNWGKYQLDDGQSDKQSDKRTDRQVTSDRQASDKQVTRNNKDNKENKDNNINNQQTNNGEGGGLITRLSDPDWDSLDSLFDNLTGLLDEVEKPGEDYSHVRNPYKYIISAAERLNWPVKSARRKRYDG